MNLYSIYGVYYGSRCLIRVEGLGFRVLGFRVQGLQVLKSIYSGRKSFLYNRYL